MLSSLNKPLRMAALKAIDIECELKAFKCLGYKTVIKLQCPPVKTT